MIRHTLPSRIASLDDDPYTQNNADLMRLLCNAAQVAAVTTIACDASKSDSRYYNVFPGEHYRLLAGLLLVLQPKCIVDIGTYTGMSTKVMIDYAPAGAEIHTFDIIDWREFDTHLDGIGFTQHLDDLSTAAGWQRHADLMQRADLILCDGPKDGFFEPIVVPKLTNGLVVVDDIRFENMFDVWRGVNHRKIDATSFGHWSGTGIVDARST